MYDTQSISHNRKIILLLHPDFHWANFGHNNDQFWAKTKRLVGRMTAQPCNSFAFCVVVVEFVVNGNQTQKYENINW